MQHDIRPGRWVFPISTTANHAVVASTLTLSPLDLPFGTSIDALGINVVTAQTAGPFTAQLGVYTGRAGANGPGALLAQAGVTGLNSTGNKTAPLDKVFALPAGRVWMAILLPATVTSLVLRGVTSSAHSSLAVDTVADGAAFVPASRTIRYAGVSVMPSNIGDDPALVPVFTDSTNVPLIAMRIAAPQQTPLIQGAQSVPTITGGRWSLPTTIGSKPALS